MDSLREVTCFLKVRTCKPFQVIAQSKIMNQNMSRNVSFNTQYILYQHFQTLYKHFSKKTVWHLCASERRKDPQRIWRKGRVTALNRKDKIKMRTPVSRG